jgi:hypothetical protein
VDFHPDFEYTQGSALYGDNQEKHVHIHATSSTHRAQVPPSLRK